MEALNIKNNFQFKGFTPNKKIREKGEVLYNLIERRAPSDSKKLAVLKKTGGSYTASLRVSSASSFSFDISCRDNSAFDSINSLQKQFFDEIIKWNKTRHPHFVLLEK